MFDDAIIKRVQYNRISRSRNDYGTVTTHSVYRPFLAKEEDYLYLKLMNGFTGQLEHFFEQGMDFAQHMVYDLDWITDDGYHAYEGQHFVTAGGLLIIFNMTGQRVFEKVVDHDMKEGIFKTALDFTNANFGLDESWFYQSFPMIWVPNFGGQL